MGKSNTARKDRQKRAKIRPRSAASRKREMDHEALDSIIHERKRLAIVSTLAVNDSLSFSELKNLLKLSDGNLSVHAQKLEAAGYIRCKKSFKGRVPRTDYRLSEKGRRTLEKYLSHMESLIKAVHKK